MTRPDDFEGADSVTADGVEETAGGAGALSAGDDSLESLTVKSANLSIDSLSSTITAMG